MYARFVASIVVLAAGAAGVIVVVLLLRTVPGPTSTSSSASSTPSAPAAPPIEGGRIATPDNNAFPSPPPGAIVLSQEAGDRALALAVTSGLVRVSVLGPTGPGVAGLKVSLQFGQGYQMAADACGPGCYQAQVEGTPNSPVSVILDGKKYVFALPNLHAADASAIVSHAEEVWNGLHTLVWRERLASSQSNAIHVVYRAIASHELEYTIAGKSAAVIIGGTRWDRTTPNAPWRASVQDPQLRQPQPFWHEALDAHVLGTGKVGGHPVWRVSFFDPSTPAWFEGTIDRKTYRTLELNMTAASHFMHDVYGPFDAPMQLHAPK
jgi:hypothetical protein